MFRTRSLCLRQFVLPGRRFHRCSSVTTRSLSTIGRPKSGWHLSLHDGHFWRNDTLLQRPLSSTSMSGKGAEATKAFVEDALKKYPVVVFSSEFCPYCAKAKGILADYKLTSNNYNVFEIDEYENVNEIMDYLKIKTGRRTLPRVFIGGKCIGGGDDTVRLNDSGELRKLLNEAIGKQ